MAIDDMINTIRKRPGMFLGSNSITALWHFLDGYQAAEKDMGVSWKGAMFPLRFKYMSEFTNIRLECHNNLGWCNNILTFCNGDEKKALDMFFDLYAEYKQIGMRRCWKAVLSEENIHWNNSTEHGVSMRNNRKELMFADPVAVYVIELTISAYILAVETSNHIKLGPQFFHSLESVKNGTIPFSAQIYFGKVDSWEELKSSNIDFGKNLIF